MKTKRFVDLENQDYEEETDSETEALQEAFAKGILKPGLNIPVREKTYVNNVEGLKNKLAELKNDLDWVERLDLINKKAPLPPELAVQMSEELKLDHTFAYNELKHESLFYRQAQDAVLIAIPKLHEVGIQTKRPEDYFAEMAKSDDHMQKVKAELIKKKAVMEKVEKVRAIRAQKKLQKQLQAQSKVRKQEAKKQFVEEVKKFRKGQRKDLGFLENKPNRKHEQQKPNKSQLKRHFKDSKFGFGGKKRGLKKNTRDSTNDIQGSGQKSRSRGSKSNSKGKPGKSKVLRPGKNRRMKIKGNKRK